MLLATSAAAVQGANASINMLDFIGNAANKVNKATTDASKSLSEHTSVSESVWYAAIVSTATIVSLVTTIGVVTEHRRRRFPKIPGKLGLPWLGSTIPFMSECTNWLAQSHEQYGDIFKAVIGGEQFICIRGDELLQQIVGSNKMDTLENGVIPAARVLFGPQSLLSANHDLHKLLKRVFTKNLGPIPVQEYFPNVIPVLLHRFEAWASPSNNVKYCNGFPVIKEAILDANLTLLLGAGAVPPEEVHDLSVELHDYSKGIISLPINMPGTAFRRACSCADSVKTRIRKLAATRKGAKDNSALTLFVNYIDPQTNQPLSMEIIEENLLIMLFASQDTTVAAVMKIITVLSERPDIVRLIREEWGCVDKPMDPKMFMNLSAADFMSKEITRATFMEALRTMPPISCTIRKAIQPVRVTTSQGLDIVIAPGTKIFGSLEATMRTSHNIPSMDPLQFNPLRFTKEYRAMMEANKTYAFCSFGGGYRMCPGRHMAELVGTLDTAIAALFYDMRMERPAEFVDTFGPRPKNDELMCAFVRRDY